MDQLIGGVGLHQDNHKADVMAVQRRLNAFASMTRAEMLHVDGACGQRTLAAIGAFQSKVMRMRHPDGIITVAGPSWRVLSGQRSERRVEKAKNVSRPAQASSSALTDADYAAAAQTLGPNVSPLLVRAFAQVESGGRSGFAPDGRPVIAFEGHWFRKFTSHKYDKSYPLLSYVYKRKAGPEWQANNKDQATAWTTLETAALLAHDAALKSCSWGCFQVMGFNYASCGYADVDDFVAAMKAGEKGQLDAFVGFCKATSGMVAALSSEDFAKMATLYNGEDYGDYDQRIARAYKDLGGA